MKHIRKQIPYLLPFIVLFSAFYCKAQSPVNFSIKNSSLASTDSLLPFWFAANRNGKIAASGSFLNVTEIFAGQTFDNASESSLSFTWGADFVAGFGKSGYYQLNRAFGGIFSKGWILKGGMFYDPVRYAGLSSSNGNITRSQNTRPHPMIRLSTLKYKPVPFMGKWLSFKAEYDEGLLNDNRYVDNAHLHHKSFYLSINPSPSWHINLGADHFVMWGGTSPNENIGKMPHSFKDYWKYVTGSSGDKDFPMGEQINIAGNQLGSYQLEVKKEFQEMNITFYLSHPFEDFSGVNWRNWPDNLLGVHFNSGKRGLITDIVYEFTNTRQQSIRDSFYVYNETEDEWERQENDNYFTHYIYRSGYTYHKKVICSPLFFPVIIKDGISNGIRSTRFFAHHAGFKGYLSEYIKWKGLITLIHHFGSYSNPFNPVRKQLSGLLEIHYANPEFPVELGFSAGIDTGNTIENNSGIQFWISKKLRDL
jgi:hypothetical protein